MSDSDNDSVGSDAHAAKIRKGKGGMVAKLRQQFEPSTDQDLAIVPSRRSARVASQPGRTGKRCRSPVDPDSPAPAAGASAGPADVLTPPPSQSAPPSSPAADASALTMEGLLARIQALEGSRTAVQQLESKLLQAQADLAATRSELAGLKSSVEQQLKEQTSHSIAREMQSRTGFSNWSRQRGPAWNASASASEPTT